MELTSGISALDILKRHSDIKTSFTLHLYQQGYSINGSLQNWRPYDQNSKLFLESIDEGIIPLGLSNVVSAYPGVKLFYYEGCVVIEIYDHRDVNDFMPNPSVRRVLLHPTPDILYTDIQSM